MIAIDAPVLVDLLSDGPHADAAEACLRQCLSAGPVVICEVALAAVCGALRDGTEALAVLEEMSIRYSPLEAKSALRAGEMQRRYRQRGGGVEVARVIPDFLIGAHALLQCDGLISRDDRFFRNYFKGLKLIVPTV
ncbi:MAG: type II toxin-antitoxin system VapC family toxin [Xanthomonadaceae bacterium]|nr:type II toxin-antitoxin system VapC family toxin [Xanthomonadaceae bacterium]